MTDTSNTGNDIGYGQQTPTESWDQFNAISFICRQMMARMDTMKLVRVEAVTAGAGDGDVKVAGTVDVLPLVSQIDGASNVTPHGTVYGIPWFRLQGGTNAVICDPVVGDIGMVVAADRDTSSVRASRKPSPPGSFRRFKISDGIYIGGALNLAPTQYLIFTDTGWRIVDKNGNSIAATEDGLTLTDKTGNVISTASTGINLTPNTGLPVTVNGNLVVKGAIQTNGSIESETGGTYAGDIKTAGNVVAGSGTADSVGLKTHTHTQPNDSHGDVEGPTSAPTAGT